MKQLQQLKTSKLFYNKWPYKLVVRLAGTGSVKREGCDKTIEYCQLPGWGRWQEINKKELTLFCKKFKQFEDKEIQMRVEYQNMSIFCDDEAMIDNMAHELQFWAHEIWKPNSAADLAVLKASKARKVMCNVLPHGKYQYRVKIKSMMDLNTRANFQNWLKNYGDKVRLSDHTVKWFSYGKGGYGWNPFILVADSATLSMIGLFLGANLSSIEEFVPRTSINTSIKEQQCQP